MPRFFAERELRSGELVLAHRQPLAETQQYAVLLPEQRVGSSAVEGFVEWLRREAGAAEAS